MYLIYSLYSQMILSMFYLHNLSFTSIIYRYVRGKLLKSNDTFDLFMDLVTALKFTFNIK